MQTNNRLSYLCQPRRKGREQKKEIIAKKEMKNVFWLSLKEGTPARFYWDQYLLEELFEYQNHVLSLDGIDEAIVIIPCAYQYDIVGKINKELSKLRKCIVIITSDEENKFPLHELQHPNMQIFATYPHETTADVTWLPIGYPPHIESKTLEDKTVDMFYAGQVNHKDRSDMIEQFKTQNMNGEMLISDGFAQGIDPKDYIKKTCQAKVIPCPKGNISYDSFRLYEALECGAVPIAQNPIFWKYLFTDEPFPITEKKEQWKGYTQDAVDQYPVLNNKCQSWWIKEKQKIKEKLIGIQDNLTVVVPVSPIPSHPSIDILETTIQSIRYHTQAEIIITFDGVRAGQEDMRSNYNEHIRRVLPKCREWKNVTPYIFDQHKHQVGMMRSVISAIKTPLLMYVESDTPLVTDEPIEWDTIKEFILSGKSNLVRFYHEAHIHPEHKNLMLKTDDIFTETVQWSQRPHVASTAFYNRILDTYFSKNANSFIEDVLHGKVVEDFYKYSRQGWEQWRLHLYTPQSTNIKRSLHSDGRAGGQKFEKKQIW